MKFVGHIVRKDGLENLALTGNMKNEEQRKTETNVPKELV